MKYFSIDIETTGLNPLYNQILQIAVIYEDTEKDIPIWDLPRKVYFIKHRELNFQEAALRMHTSTGLLDVYFESERYWLDDAIQEIVEWMGDELGVEQREIDGKLMINVAGKNFNAFDRRFLDESFAWTMNIYAHRRVIDPAVFYVDWEKDDVLPNLTKCLNRAGFGTDVTHDAEDDAMDVIRVIRSYIEDAEKLPE